MKKLIEYIRSCFCRHEFIIETDQMLNTKQKYLSEDGKYFEHHYIDVTLIICKKCGYTRKIIHKV